VLSVAVNFVIMAFTIFFFFKDGPGFFQKFRSYLPFSEQQRDRLTSQVKDMIVSTIYGGVVVAVVQGILGGIAFSIVGIHSPIFWGSAMALTSFIPMLGTAVIWLPASIILLLNGAYVKGIGLALIGIFVISMVDNILKPLIIGGRTKMPTVVIFFTVLGGIKLFGLLGLVMGPLVFALFLSVFEIFRTVEGETQP
jgi:predicted PurR-regulated permease PerM